MVKVRVNGEAVDGERSVKLFEVFNTAHRSLLVLATDRAESIEMAYRANHIHFIWNRKDISYPHVAEVHNPIIDPKLANHGDLIQVAIARRLRGTVNVDGGHLYVGNQIVSA